MRSRPFIKRDSIYIVEARCFGAALQFFVEDVSKQPITEEEKARRRKDASVADIIKLVLIRPGERGRMGIFGKHLAQRGGLIGLGAIDLDRSDGEGEEAMMKTCSASYGRVRWFDVFSLSYAKSRDIFEAEGVGEQVFAMPDKQNCMALLDDVRTPDLLFNDAAGLSMETSQGNFQHLYAFDRVLTPDERGAIQRALVQHAQGLGVGGDAAATGPEQPHRVPGSVNYKPGRGLFVCRLVGTWLRVDGARPMSADEWVARGWDAPAAAPAVASPAGLPGLRRGPVAAGHKSDSEADWAWACAEAEASRGLIGADELAHRLERELAARARLRRGRDAERYAMRTVASLRAHGKF